MGPQVISESRDSPFRHAVGVERVQSLAYVWSVDLAIFAVERGVFQNLEGFKDAHSRTGYCLLDSPFNDRLGPAKRKTSLTISARRGSSCFMAATFARKTVHLCVQQFDVDRLPIVTRHGVIPPKFARRSEHIVSYSSGKVVTKLCSRRSQTRMDLANMTLRSDFDPIMLEETEIKLSKYSYRGQGNGGSASVSAKISVTIWEVF